MKILGQRKSHSHTHISKGELEKLYLQDHLTYEEIGAMLGITRAAVYYKIKKFGIDTATGERFDVICSFKPCSRSYSTTRKRFKLLNGGLNYCSQNCYFAHKLEVGGSAYMPHKHGQRTARAVMEATINRKLLPGEVVHHIDGNCANNSIDNLILFPSQSEHLKHHHSKRK